MTATVCVLTVAHQQYTYPETEKMIRAWIVELGLDKQFPDTDWYVMVLDKALFPAFSQLASLVRNSSQNTQLRELPTPEQNKLAGRYLSQLAIITNIAGPDKSTPVDIVNRFYKIYRSRRQGAVIRSH